MRISDWSSDVCSSDLKVASQPSIPITGDHRLQHVAPVMGAMDGAGAQRASLQVAELDENEQVPVVGAAELAIVDRAPMVRSEERRVGKECVSTCRSRGSPDH